MDLKSLDQLEYSIELINGLRDNMIHLESAKKDKELSATVLCTFEVVLEKSACCFVKLKRWKG